MKNFLPAAFYLIAEISFVCSKHESLNMSQEFVKVLLDINDKVFASKSSFVRIITQDIDGLPDELFSTHRHSLSFELIESSKLYNSFLKPSSSNIIFFDSFLEFKKIARSKVFNSGGHFLVVLIACDDDTENKIFETAWRYYMWNVDIICNEIDDAISIKTFWPFQEDSCANTTSIMVRFDRHSINQIFPEKFKNLFECPIKVATFYYPPITMRDTLPNGTSRYYGSEMEMVFGLAQALNFSIKMTYIAQSGFTGLLYENGTATGIMKETIEGEQEMLMGFYYLTYLRTQHMSFTQSHYSIPLVLLA